MNRAEKPSPFSLIKPILLCSVSKVAASNVTEGWCTQGSDPNLTQIQTLYAKSGVQYPSEFTCFIAVIDKPKSNWIEAYGMKSKPAVVKVSEAIANPSSSTSTPADLSALFASGVVLLAKPHLISEIAVAAPGDISQIAGANRKVALTDIRRLADDEQRRTSLKALIQQAGNTYCEARLHRKLCYSEIEAVYSLSEFHQYVSP